MAQPSEFEPTDIFKHRYQDPSVLITYLKKLGFTDDQIRIKVCGLHFAGPPARADLGTQLMGGGQIGLRLPRKLEKVGVGVKVLCKAATNISSGRDRGGTQCFYQG